MATAVAMTAGRRLITTDELLALPDDGIHRELIRGQVREFDITAQSTRHCLVQARLSQLLLNWLDASGQGGKLMCGEVRVRLRKDPGTLVGIDLAYVSAELFEPVKHGADLIDGPPILAVEILSRSDTHETVVETVEEYLATGVQVVWIVDPDFRTVRVHRPGQAPLLYNRQQELVGDPELPGFRVAVSKIMDD